MTEEIKRKCYTCIYIVAVCVAAKASIEETLKQALGE